MAEIPVCAPERLALLRGLAQQAAAWWRTQLADPGYASKFDNGDRSQAGELTQILASMAALSSPGPAESSLDRFGQLLAERLLERMQQDPLPSRPEYAGPARYCVLSVDYGPEGLLRQVASEAGVGGFPWKTTMWVNWDANPAHCHVEVSKGYGAATQRLPAPAATT